MGKKLRYSGITLLLVFLIALGFLIYDHNKYYGDKKTPKNVKTMRNISLVIVFTSIVIMTVVGGRMLYKAEENKTNGAMMAIMLFIFVVWLLSCVYYAVYYFILKKEYTNTDKYDKYGNEINKMPKSYDKLANIAGWIAGIGVLLIVFMTCASNPSGCLLFAVASN